MAITLYRSSDRVRLKILDVIFHVSPLTKDQKSKILAHTQLSGGESITNLTNATADLIKYSVKDIEGVNLPDGSQYKLDFDGEYLSDNCVSDLMNIEMSDKLTSSLFNFLRGIPSTLVDHQTGKELEGVEILRKGN